ncbi:hypothetical protein BLA29_008807 [Euroglyphus maynei]|uniref:Uncharacterized protein n=1 Tax=Euroglyphus maynei TaxID=6958 RepID=A0A1Y3AQZ2_EURMA|nr:hypothetical protein BLA29_008807 [Euroglyphus maynei]
MKSTNNSKNNTSRSMAFTEHGAYMRIFRICFVEFQSSPSSLPLINNLGNRLFTPTKRTDTITDIIQRLHDWIKHYTEKRQKTIDDNNDSNESITASMNEPILSAETVEIFMKDLPKNRTDIERAANDDTFLIPLQI